ncbi:MAG: hypothetical protein SGILL_006683 [Bacillariaceae sp.]
MASSEMDMVEDRLRLIDSWLVDQPENERLMEKRDEYLGLLEELTILSKKLKKTSKLLVQEDKQPVLLKLAKKQEQYSHEIEDILAYVDQDALFAEAEMDPSDLLGVPLETLVEQPGMEGSSATLNFSVSDLPYMPPKIGGSAAGNNSSTTLDHNGSGVLEEYEELHPIKEEQSFHYNSMGSLPPASTHSSASIEASLHSTASAHSAISVHDTETLRKKLQKVEKLLEDQQNMDKKQIKKLKKKRDEYASALEHLGSGDSIDPNSVNGRSVASFADSSIGTTDVSTSSFFHPSQDGGAGDLSNLKGYDKQTVQKKLRKVKKLIDATTDEAKLESFRMKQQEYEQTLDEIAAAEGGGSMSSFGDSNASIPMDDLLVELDEEERRKWKVTKKKLQKVERILAEATESGDVKQTKKMERKRDEYLAILDEITQR